MKIEYFVVEKKAGKLDSFQPDTIENGLYTPSNGI